LQPYYGPETVGILGNAKMDGVSSGSERWKIITPGKG
jgi:hypothetical protein